MSGLIKISPSILSADFSKLGNEGDFFVKRQELTTFT